MRTLPVPHTAIVHGDARCFSIACASIVAKVTRDRLMTRLALRYPAYTWERNVGYTTRAHIRGLDSNGITPHHRRSFFRVSQLLLDFGEAPSLDEMQSAESRDELIILTDIDATISEEIAQA
jgi:ribonuclease HII